MANSSDPNVDSLPRDETAISAQELAGLFDQHRERLRQMVRLRMDHRLHGRVDPSDILQDAYLECARRLADYRTKPSMSLFLWMRYLTVQKLVDVHRAHLGAKIRDARREVSLYSSALPQASSITLAAHLLGKLTSPSNAAIRAERQIRVQQALNVLEPIDREILALRHFEMLSNEETAQVLCLTKAAASNRYIRALRRIKVVLAEISGQNP